MDDATDTPPPVAAITGFAPGLGTALAERLLAKGYAVAGLSRSGRHLVQTGGSGPADRFRAYPCDVGDAEAVAATFAALRRSLGPPRLLIHNAAQLHIGDFEDTSSADFERLWRVACLGAVLTAKAVLPAMVEAGSGVVLFAGATASVRGGARFAAFASAKFALRGLAQSLARQYGTKGVHVIHTLIDGVIWGDRAAERFAKVPAACLRPEAIADTYMHLIEQDPSSWTHEIDLRPDRESF